MADENVVRYGDREFELEEPTTGIVLRILNAIGAVAVRAEGMASRLVKSPTNRAVLFGLLAVMSENDLARLGSAVLQFEDDRKGRKWIKEQGVKVAPIIDALMVNLRLSEDLVEAVASFFGGIEGLTGILDKLIPTPQTEAETEEETDEVRDKDESAG
jgi:hypothetical protein